MKIKEAWKTLVPGDGMFYYGDDDPVPVRVAARDGLIVVLVGAAALVTLLVALQ